MNATRLLAIVVVRKRAENTFLTVGLVALLLLVFCSVAVLHFETHLDSIIKSADDAVWWAFTTITTVGYGDRYPVTGEGRSVAAILMAAGVGLFGTFSGLLAAWFLGPGQGSDESSELFQLRQEGAALRERVATIASGAPGGHGPGKHAESPSPHER